MNAYVEIEGKNCRFLQGKDTDPKDIQTIRDAVREKRPQSVCLLNYTKTGKPFMNQFFLAPLFNDKGEVAYFLGVQFQVPSKNDGKESVNPGWQAWSFNRF